MCKTIYFSLAFLLALCALATVESIDIRMCSTQLSDMLARLCEGTGKKGYNRMIERKRSGNPLVDFDPLDPIQYIEQKESPNSAELLTYPMINNGRLHNIFRPENALSSLTATRRRTRGDIVDECCARACRTSELLAYCAA
ncbi:probable insulin-like peptide 3 [Drosophila albomicans]|uniref:Probable insulin-like peptide 3 n=1 Tax=Drosophila albomicans TaxID=7291 RepID=A0A6P8WQZ6_DROAB|nr:probable insulin-like peptide 3 [Drosophila albomicans]